MNIQDKTKEELIKEVQELQQENISLKATYEKDIAKYRQNEKKLQISEAQKKAILNGISANIAFVDRNLKIIWANKTAADSVKKSPDEMIGFSCHHFWADPSSPCDNCPSLKAFDTKKSENSIMFTPDGRVWDERGEPIFDTAGELIGVLEIATDITDRKKAEQALHESEEKFKAVADTSPLAIYLSSGIEQTAEYINPTFIKLFGYTIDDVPSAEQWWPLAYPDEYYRRQVEEEWQRKVECAINTQTEIEPLEVVVTCKDGSHRNVQWGFKTIGKQNWAFGLDLTERKKAEELLRENKEKYRILTENMKDVVWILDTSSLRFLYVSPSVTKLRGYTPEEIMAEPMDAALTPEIAILFKQVIHQNVDNLLAGVESYDNFFIEEVEQPCKDGSTVWTEVITKYNLNEKTGLVELWGVTREISERKKAALEIKLKSEELQKLNSQKDKFFSIIAHDLKSPFSAILGFSGMLKREAPNLEIDSIVKYADVINSSSQQTFRLLENLLDWARMQQDIVPFEPKAIILNSLINNEIESLKYNADQKNITLVNMASDEIIVTADENMLGTILRNLISNAIKFTPKDGKVNVEAKMNLNQVEISVSDTGIGIKKENIEKLFKIETSFSTRGTGNEKGSGLGLLLCKEFVEKHGGTILVESEPGKGSKFQFTIPSKN